MMKRGTANWFSIESGFLRHTFDAFSSDDKTLQLQACMCLPGEKRRTFLIDPVGKEWLFFSFFLNL